MSEQSQGPGWWIASDGKWYPPEAAAEPPATSDATLLSSEPPSADDRPWYKKKRFIIPIAIFVLLLIVAALSDGDEETSTSNTTTTTEAPDMEAALLAANVDIAGVTDGDVEDLINLVCSGADADEIAERVVEISDLEPADVSDLLVGVGDGAEVYCPDVVAENPDLINDAIEATSLLLAASTTTTTAAPTTTTTVPPTTAPPTTAPPATAPPTTAPPASGVYYENCDAARAAGAAPLYAGDPGYRPGLDRDGDGVACE